MGADKTFMRLDTSAAERNQEHQKEVFYGKYRRHHHILPEESAPIPD